MTNYNKFFVEVGYILRNLTLLNSHRSPVVYSFSLDFMFLVVEYLNYYILVFHICDVLFCHVKLTWWLEKHFQVLNRHLGNCRSHFAQFHDNWSMWEHGSYIHGLSGLNGGSPQKVCQCPNPWECNDLEKGCWLQ